MDYSSSNRTILYLILFFLLHPASYSAGMVPPVINSILDDSTIQNEEYVSPAPSLTEGTLPVTWSLVSSPDSMVIEPETGVVSWLEPKIGIGPHVITIEASNAWGTDQVSWLLDVQVRRWEPVVLSFISESTIDWNLFPLQVTFTNGNTVITVDGYWDGGNIWKVRFAPTISGVWAWSSTSTDNKMNGQSGAFTAIEPDAADVSTNSNYRGHVRVSSNNRYFEYNDGTPFFWIGDTNWAITTIRCGIDNGNFYTYLNDRLAKNFSVIQIQFLGPTETNEGGKAIITYPDDWYGLNYAYFQSVDVRIGKIWESGLVIAGHPTWFSEYYITLKEAKDISRYLWARYGAYNIVWSMSGEYSTAYINSRNQFTVEDWEELGSYVEQIQGHSHPISVHPRAYVSSNPSVSFSSSHEFHDSSWLDHNWVQSFFYLEEVKRQISADYSRKPTKPVLHAEGAYEAGYPTSYNLVMDYELIDDQLVRLQAWTAFLNGAAGHTYGANGVWPMYDPSFGYPGIHDENTNPWYEDILLAGSSDLQHIKDFFSAFEWNTFEPLSSWIRVNGLPVSPPSASNYSFPSAFGKWADTYIIYIPKGVTDNIIEIQHLACADYTAKWFNPQTGQYASIATPPSFVSNWIIPSRPDTNDWVVLLEKTPDLPGGIEIPVIEQIPDETQKSSTSYTGPEPVLNQEASCVTWVLLNGPAGMEIDSSTGVVSWLNPTPIGSPHLIKIRAMNLAGSDEEYWQLTVKQEAIRVNAGAGEYTDVLGNVWSADYGFNTGLTDSTIEEIANTLDDALYQQGRWDPGASPELEYSFDVINGSYTVNLHFADIWPGTYGIGLRLFDILIEGVIVENDLDIFAQVGENAALVKSYDVMVTDGQLNIRFLHVMENTKVCAIEIVPLASDSQPPIWDGASAGISLASDMTTGGSVRVEFNTASDDVDGENVKYNVYYAKSIEWNSTDWRNNSILLDVPITAGTTFAHSYLLTNLTNGIDYTIGVRVEDQSGNEDINTTTIMVTPTSQSTITCESDFVPIDGDVDGADLAAYGEDDRGIGLPDFATDFGRVNCQ